MCYLLFSSSFSYTPSIYPRLDDFVVIGEVDGFEILGTVPKPTNIKHIKEAHLSTIELGDTDYPSIRYPGAPTVEKLQAYINETKAINNLYCANKNPLNYTQEDAYYHPAGIDQYKGDHELINQSERYFARVYLNPKRGAYHWTGLYDTHTHLALTALRASCKR